MSTDSRGYSRIAITLHWLIAFMIIGQIVGGKYMHGMELGPDKYQLYQMHKSFGIVILLLSFLRLLWRLTHKAPPLPDGMSGFERFGAKASHFGFYVLMIGTPLVGWMMVSASPTAIPTKLFKTIPWPDFPFISRSEGLNDFFVETHEVMATMIIALLVLHVAAALKHHLVNKDDVLTRMLPFLKVKS